MVLKIRHSEDKVHYHHNLHHDVTYSTRRLKVRCPLFTKDSELPQPTYHVQLFTRKALLVSRKVAKEGLTFFVHSMDD